MRPVSILLNGTFGTHSLRGDYEPLAGGHALEFVLSGSPMRIECYDAGNARLVREGELSYDIRLGNESSKTSLFTPHGEIAAIARLIRMDCAVLDCAGKIELEYFIDLNGEASVTLEFTPEGTHGDD